MKNKTKMLVTLTAAVAVIGMSSCKKDPVEPPKGINQEDVVKPAGGEEAHRNSNVILLSKAGNTTMTYMPNNKIWTVNYGNGTVKTYTYSSQFNVIIATSAYNGVKTTQITYFLNAAGLATKMGYKAYSNQGNVYIDAEYQFTYTNGKLTEQKATKGFSDKYLFKYDASGRLEWLEQYKWNGDLVEKMNYKYGDFVNQPDITDKNLINPREAFLDDYLKIFGVFSNHLMRAQKYYKGAIFTHHQFTYQFNNNGYATERKEWSALGYAPLIETIGYNYITGM